MRSKRACETAQRQNDARLDVTVPSGYRDRRVWSRTHSPDQARHATPEHQWVNPALQVFERLYGRPTTGAPAVVADASVPACPRAITPPCHIGPMNKAIAR